MTRLPLEEGKGRVYGLRPGNAPAADMRPGFIDMLKWHEAARETRRGLAPGQPRTSVLSPEEWTEQQRKLAEIARGDLS